MSVDTLSEASLPHSVPETVLHSVAGTVLDISDLSDGSGDPESGGSDAVLEVSVPARTAVINWLAHLRQLHNVAQPLREEQMLVYETMTRRVAQERNGRCVKQNRSVRSVSGRVGHIVCTAFTRLAVFSYAQCGLISMTVSLVNMSSRTNASEFGAASLRMHANILFTVAVSSCY